MRRTGGACLLPMRHARVTRYMSLELRRAESAAREEPMPSMERCISAPSAVGTPGIPVGRTVAGSTRLTMDHQS